MFQKVSLGSCATNSANLELKKIEEYEQLCCSELTGFQV